jgi:hypothetical protein
LGKTAGGMDVSQIQLDERGLTMCDVQAIMHKDEQYARGVLRLDPKHRDATEMAQYVLDLQKLRHAHEGRCKTCLGTSQGGE